jgi:hypothetical protein
MASSTADAAQIAHPAGRAPGLARRLTHPSAIAVVAIVTAAVLLYVRPVVELGFYYDDWLLLSAMQDAGGGWLDRLAACRGVDPAGRIGGCLYHASANFAFGEHASAYHVLSIALLSAGGVLLYALLRRCGLGHWPSLLASVLFVIYPGSDSTRLWPTGLAAQYVLAAYLGALLLAIEGLRRTATRTHALAWHAASLALFVLLLFTYEVVVPLIAIAGAVYLLSAWEHRRAAIARGAVDLVVALAFTYYRLVLEPVRAGSGFVEGRTLGDTIDRLRGVLHGTWTSFQTLFLPGTAALIVAVAAALIWLAAVAVSADARRASLRWIVAVAAAGAFAVVSVLPFVPANGLYVPDTDSLFNRLNLAAAPAYCVLFVALCGLLWTALTRWLPRAAATALVGVLVLLVAAGQVGHERRSQDAWAASWDAQVAALDNMREVAPRLDRNASVMSFGHPIWERGFIPVFAASWDLKGAIVQETDVDAPRALPFVDQAACAATEVTLEGAPYLAYRASSPLWFVNLASGQARRITSLAQCERAVADWGRPPFWGKTVTG